MPEIVQNTSNLPLNQNPGSIYYTQPSDTNSIQLVSFKFNGEGFTSWKRSMLLTLSAKNKVGFVNGMIKKPVDESCAEFKAWERCNDLVCSWILFNLEESIAGSVMFRRGVREIWLDLEERYGYTSLAQIYGLEQKLSETTKGTQSVSEFFNGIKSIWDAIDEAHPLPYCTCNNCICNLTKRIYERHQEKMVIQFMMKLSEKYATIRGNMLMMQSLPKVTDAYRMFAQEEKHKEISQMHSHTEPMAFAAEKRRFNDNFQSKNTKSRNIGNSQGQTNFQKQGTYKQAGNGAKIDKPGSKYYCTHCEVPGHSVDRCFKIHGYPPNFRGLKRKAAAVAGNDAVDMEVDKMAGKVLSVEQYNQPMNILNSQKIGDKSESSNKHVLMAEGNLDSSW